MNSESSSASPDAKRDEAELIGRIIQSEQKLTDYFTTVITRSVTDQLDRRNVIRLRVIGMVAAALLTVAIPGTMSWIRDSISKQTEAAMTAGFGQATAEIQAQFSTFLEKERAYTSFTNRLLYLSAQTTVRESELTEIRAQLEQLGGDPAVRKRAGFPLTLDLVARLAVDHGDRITLDLLQKEFSHQMTAPRTQSRLARYYGERVIGDVFTSPAKRAEIAALFQSYIDAAEAGPDFENLLPLQAMVDVEVHPAEAAKSLAQIKLHIKELSPADQASFIAETVRYSNPEFWEATTTEHSRRIALGAGQLVIDQKDFYVDLLGNVAVETALIDVSEAEANKGNTGFSTALVGFRNAFSNQYESTAGVEFRAAIEGYVRTDIAPMMSSSAVIDAIRVQNSETHSYSPARIGELQAQWHQEFEAGAYKLIASVQGRPISRLLRRFKRDGDGIYSKMSLIDAAGLLVGASDINRNYWVGDLDRWTKTFKAGTGALYIEDLTFDVAGFNWMVRISEVISDPATGAPIGVWSLAIDPGKLGQIQSGAGD